MERGIYTGSAKLTQLEEVNSCNMSPQWLEKHHIVIAGCRKEMWCGTQRPFLVVLGRRTSAPLRTSTQPTANVTLCVRISDLPLQSAVHQGCPVVTSPAFSMALEVLACAITQREELIMRRKKGLFRFTVDIIVYI